MSKDSFNFQLFMNWELLKTEVNPFALPCFRSSRLFEEFSLRQQILEAVGGLLQCIYDHIRQLGKWSVRSTAVHLSLPLQLVWHHRSNNCRHKSFKWPKFSIGIEIVEWGTKKIWKVGFFYEFEFSRQKYRSGYSEI